MNKIVKTIELAGKEYPLTFSFGAFEAVGKAFGSIDGMQKAIADNDDPIAKLSALNTVMEIMINDGIRYCKLIGQDAPDTLDFRPIDVIDAHDNEKLNIIFEVLMNDNKREVEAKPPKNVKSTPKK